MTMPSSSIMDDDNNNDDDGEFQVQNTKKKNSNNQPRRVYFGGLPTTFDTSEMLQQELKNWIQEQMTPSIIDLNIGSIEIHEGRTSSSSFALVDCGNSAGHVVSKLHQKTWNGKKLTVQREKKPPKQKQQQQPQKQQQQQQQRNHRGGNKKNNNRKFNDTARKQSWGSKGWSKPQQEQEEDPVPKFTQIPVEQATEEIAGVVTEEIKIAEEGGDDMINVALASTAAASYLAAMNAFQETNGDVATTTTTNAEQETGSEGKETADDSANDGGGADSSGRFQLQDMSTLLADLGEEDKDWKKQEVTVDDNDNNDGSAVATTSNGGPSRLAPHGKAPIHIVFESFGYKYGSPKRPDGWTIAQPLAPLDCSSDYETVPQYLQWMTGKTGAVKRVIDPNLVEYAQTIVADSVMDCLLQAQDLGYGYSQPLKMTVYLGSELGRHRSVFACEKAAIKLRSKLRLNLDNRIKQPVSVGTRHRDIDRTGTSDKKKKKNSDDSDEEV